MKRVIALAVLSVLFFNANQPHVPLQEENQRVFTDNSDPAIIGFDDGNGVIITADSTISGFIVASVSPDSSEWQISELSYSGDMIDITQPTPLPIEEIFSNQDDGLTRWSWEITDIFESTAFENTTGINCTCYLSVTVNSAELSSTRLLALFLGEPLHPGVILDNDPEQYGMIPTHSGSVDFSGWISNPSPDSVPTSIHIVNEASSSGLCMTTPDNTTVRENTSTSMYYYSWFNGQFSLNIDISSLDDGWYSVWYSLHSTDNDDVIQHVCSQAMVDNSNPVAFLEGPEQIQEGDGNLIFDAGESYDPFWGKESLNYIWSLIKIEASGNYLVDYSEGLGSSFFVVEDSISGNYALSLLVVDGQGMTARSDIEFSIINLPPLAKLSISGQSLSDGDKMQLSELSDWELDATQSLDTSNDAEGLRCVWKLNYKTIYEGCERTFQWPEEDYNDTILLTLDVIDDDEEYSSITVELSRANSEDSIPLSIIVLILSTLFFISSVIYSRRRNDDMEIPKWNEIKST